MAAYDNLRAVIAANVYQNNNNEVTADMVKTAMEAMVNSLGAEFQFGGVAVPADNPGTPDYKVAYLAATPGTYTNFGGIVVADGEVVNLKWDGTAWSKEVVCQLLGTAPDAINGGTKLLLAGAVQAVVATQDEMMSANNALVDAAPATIFPVSIISGKAATDTGLVGSGSYDVWVYAIEAGKNYTMNAVLPYGIDRRLVYYSTDAAGANIVGWDKYKGSAESTERQYFAGNLTIAPTAQYILMNIRTLSAFADLYSVKSIAREPLIKVRDLAFSALRKDLVAQSPASILLNTRTYNGEIQASTGLDLHVYNIDPTKAYCFSGILPANVNVPFIGYYDADDNFLSYDDFKGSLTEIVVYSHKLLTIPAKAAKIKMNVSHVYSTDFDLSLIEPQARDTNEPVAPLKVVVFDNKRFYVRYHIDDTNDGLLLFDHYTAYGLNNNCIMTSRYYVGARTESDDQILAHADFQNCRDSQSPMFTSNFGPLFSNHGYSTPRVRIVGHSLTSADIGTEWYDQSGYHYTIGNIDGDFIYLLPVIDTSGGPGYETRGWKWYASTNPTQITRDVPGGETLSVTSSSRWDYQVAELQNVRVLINGAPVEAGVYLCNEVELAYEQIGYNPIDVSAWWPSPVYGDKMLIFNRHFTITGGSGLLSMTANTTANVLYPFPLYHYIDVVPQFPFQMGDFVPYIYIPKMKKVTEDIDFRAEFASPDDTHPAVNYSRTAADLVDVDDLPDRAYCYMKDSGGNILFGCAGGHSLVRGMSVPSIRNNYVNVGSHLGIWNPPAGNKHYNNVLHDTGEADNMMPVTFINEFEGYMCWYKPTAGVHAFYHRTKEGYAVYIHTKETIAKGEAILPDFMNNLAVVQTIEKTAGIDLLTNTVIDGKLYFTADASEVEYNYIVVLMK